MNEYPLNLIKAALGDDVSADASKVPLWLSHLTDRERTIIELRYLKGLSLAEVGKEFNVTRERIRQIEAKALKKLAHPAYRKDVEAISLAEHLAALHLKQEELAALRQKYRALREYAESLHEAIAKEIPSLTRILTVLPDAYKTEEDIPDMNIEDLELTIRSELCLQRAGIYTARGAERMTLDEMKQIRNLGKRSIDEIRDKLIEYGFAPKF